MNILKNQNVDIAYHNQLIKVTSLQNNSTPGIFFQMPINNFTDYEITVDISKVSQCTLFFYIVNADDKKDVILQGETIYLENGNNELCFKSELVDNVKIGIFFTGCQVGQSFLINSFNLQKKETEVKKPVVEEPVIKEPVIREPVVEKPSKNTFKKVVIVSEEDGLFIYKLKKYLKKKYSSNIIMNSVDLAGCDAIFVHNITDYTYEFVSRHCSQILEKVYLYVDKVHSLMMKNTYFHKVENELLDTCQNVIFSNELIKNYFEDNFEFDKESKVINNLPYSDKRIVLKSSNEKVHKDSTEIAFIFYYTLNDLTLLKTLANQFPWITINIYGVFSEYVYEFDEENIKYFDVDVHDLHFAINKHDIGIVISKNDVCGNLVEDPVTYDFIKAKLPIAFYPTENSINMVHEEQMIKYGCGYEINKEKDMYKQLKNIRVIKISGLSRTFENEMQL